MGFKLMISVICLYLCIGDASHLLICYFKVWVLDATPGKVRAGGDGEDHPAELISFLRTLPNEVVDRGCS